MEDGNGQVTFMFQVGLVRDFVTTDASQLTLKTLKDLACNFINQRVSLEAPASRNSPSSINQLDARSSARTKALSPNELPPPADSNVNAIPSIGRAFDRADSDRRRLLGRGRAPLTVAFVSSRRSEDSAGAR